MNMMIKFIPPWFSTMASFKGLTLSEAESMLTPGDRSVFGDAQYFLARTFGYFSIDKNFNFLKFGDGETIEDAAIAALGTKLARPLPDVNEVFTRLSFSVDPDLKTILVKYNPQQQSTKKAVMRQLIITCATIAGEKEVLRSHFFQRFLEMKEETSFESADPSMEGFLDLLTGLFKKKNPTQSTQSLVDLKQWIETHVSGAKLKDSVSPVDKPTSITGSAAMITCRGKVKQFTSLSTFLPELKAEVDHLKKVASTYKGDVKAEVKKFEPLEKAINALPDGLQDMDKLIDVLNKYIGLRYDSVAEKVHRSDNHIYLGDFKNPAIVVTNKSNIPFEFNPSPRSQNPGVNKTFTVPTISELNQLYSLITELVTLENELYTEWENCSSGFDYTDPPFRAFSDELFDDPAIAKLLNMYHVDEFDGQVTGLFLTVANRAEGISKACMDLLIKLCK